MNKWINLVTLCFLGIFLVSCAASEGKGNDITYEETKKMIVDILKTDEGKKALQDVLTDEKFKQEIVMDQATVKKAIEDTLVSEKGKKFWQEQFKDEKFAETFAKGMDKSTGVLMKKLMNDPEYQRKMMEIMQNPEMEKNFEKLMKSDKMRSHYQKLIGEAFDNPLFKAEIYDMLKKVADEELKAEGGNDQQQQVGGGGQGGGGGEGEG